MINHTRKDALLTKAIAMPAAGASANTEGIDILQSGGLDNIALVVGVPDLPNLVASKKVTVKFQGASDGVSAWSDVASAGTLSLAGAAGGGTTGTELRVRCPFDCPQFVRATVSVEAAGGDNTSASIEFSVQV